MNDDKKILFLERLTKLLNGTIKEKEQSTIESEKFCDALKWKLSRIMEEIYKLYQEFAAYEKLEDYFSASRQEMEKLMFQDNLLHTLIIYKTV